MTIIRPYASEQKKGHLPPYLIQNVHAYRKSFIFVSGGTVFTIVLPTQMHFSKVISQHMTVQVKWKVPAWGLTFQLPQQTIIIRIASHGVFTKSSSFQISYLILTVEFNPFLGYLQLDHPVTCEIIKCYSHIKIIT